MKTIKSRKTAQLDEITSKVWKTKKFDDILLWLCNTVHNKTEMDERWPQTHQELTAMSSKVFNSLLHNHIQSKLGKFSGKIWMVSGINDPQLPIL